MKPKHVVLVTVVGYRPGSRAGGKSRYKVSREKIFDPWLQCHVSVLKDGFGKRIWSWRLFRRLSTAEDGFIRVSTTSELVVITAASKPNNSTTFLDTFLDTF